VRSFVNLSGDIQNKLAEKFPELYRIFSAEFTPGYKCLAVSVFDHWLSEEEASELLGNVPVSEQSHRNNLLHSFSNKVCIETEVINFRFRGRYKKLHPLFRAFTSDKALHRYMQPAESLPGKSFFSVVLPELDAVFMENWDDTNLFFLRDPSIETVIRGWAEECGVFCLE